MFEFPKNEHNINPEHHDALERIHGIVRWYSEGVITAREAVHRIGEITDEFPKDGVTFCIKA